MIQDRDAWTVQVGQPHLARGMFLARQCYIDYVLKIQMSSNIHGSGNNGKLNQNRGLRWTKDAYLECYQCDSQGSFSNFSQAPT